MDRRPDDLPNATLAGRSTVRGDKDAMTQHIISLLAATDSEGKKQTS